MAREAENQASDWSGKANQSVGPESHWKPGELGWYNEFCQPISDALWHHDFALVQNNIVKGRKAVSDGTVEGQEADCLAAQLNYMDFQWAFMRLYSVPKEDRKTDCKPQLAKIIKTTLIPQEDLSERETFQNQIRLYLMACCSARFEPSLLSEDTFFAWHGQLEQKYKNTEYWTFVTFWAFDNEILDLLEQGYNYLLFKGTGFYSEYSFKRVELMLKLRRTVAKEEDLLDLIKLSIVINQLKSVKVIFLEEATKQGLWSPEVNRFYNDFLLELSHNRSTRAQRLIDSGE